MKKLYDREYYINNRDKINARTMANYYSHRVERLERFKAYYEKNKEYLKQKQIERRANKAKPKYVFEITHNVIVDITENNK
jgi:hypothetical protein